MKRRNLLVGTAGLLALGGAGVLAWKDATGSMRDYTRYAADLRAPLPSEPAIGDLLRFATLAPNGHNTQPWRFSVRNDSVEILPDLARRTPVVDPDDHHLFVSLGAAAETLLIAGIATGRPGEITVRDDGSVTCTFATGRPAPSPLFDAIPLRQSTRADFDGLPIGAADLRTLETAAAVPGVALTLLTDPARIASVRDLILEGNSQQLSDPAFRSELLQWVRFTPRRAMSTGDGLFGPASGNPALPEALGAIGLRLTLKAASENRKYARQIGTSAGLAVFTGARADRTYWVAVGRACQRFALAATALGIRTSFVNQPVEVASLRPELALLIGAPGERPDLVLRFGRGPALPFSPRRRVDAVLDA